MTVFDHQDYKKFVRQLLMSMPKQGRGQYHRLAQHLGVNSVIVSQIFAAERDLSPEQALETAEFFGLSEVESEYFLLLVQRERAGTQKLKLRLSNRLESIRTQAQDLKTRVRQDRQLDEAAKAQFYSNWYYSGIRLLTSIDQYQDLDTIAKALELPRSLVRKVLDFLLTNGLCIESADKIVMGPQSTHLEASSAHINRHHTNWRLKGIQNMTDLQPDELFYTAPMSLPLEVVPVIRKDLVDLIEKVVKRVSVSGSETLACLNIDWFRPRLK